MKTIRRLGNATIGVLAVSTLLGAPGAAVSVARCEG